MTIKEVRIIHDIDSNNFLVNGVLYVNIIDDENHSMNLINKSIASFSFENTVSKIIEDSSAANKIKTEEYYSKEITSFFEKNRSKKNGYYFLHRTWN